MHRSHIERPRDWVIRGAVRSDVGKKRRNNEDAFGFFPELALYVVADGMGGHAAGQVASALTVEALRQSLAETADEDLTPVSDESGTSSLAGRRLMIAIQNANERILETGRNNPELTGMGTTVAALVFDRGSDSVAVCHVGDSRAYRIRNQAIEQLTRDHTVVQRLVQDGKLREDEVSSSTHRHVLTQAVGATEALHPDVWLDRPFAGDVFVLCSDGLHDAVEGEEILDIVRQAGTDLDQGCSKLVALANERGGRDNTTVMIVACEGPSAGG